MSPAGRVIVFTLAMIGAFSALVTWGIPRIDAEPPPVDTAFNIEDATPQRLAEIGEAVFRGKGTCLLCHDKDGNRAPNLDDPIALAKARLADVRYKGDATDTEAFLRESLVAPSVYVPVGYGKVGSSDTVSPMPDVRGGALRLSAIEVETVIAYLQNLSGAEITVRLPEIEEDDEEEDRAPFTKPDEILAYFDCLACHKLNDQGEELGPALTGIGAKQSTDYLRRAITEPNTDIPEGFEPDMMPPDYAEQMSETELNMLVNFLSALK